MSAEMTRILCALAVGGIVGWQVFTFARQGIKEYWRRNTIVQGGSILPLFVMAVFFVSLLSGVVEDWNDALGMFGWMVGIFLLISVYYVLLTLALPLLRRHLRAEACAMLWIVPNCLYLTTYFRGWSQPRWVIPLPAQWLAAAGLVWLAGAVGVLGWKIFTHLRFRRWLLRDAEDVVDPEELAVWQEELARVGEKGREFVLVTSPQATTPMTIGLAPKSMRVVLPQRHYTREELKLIFRHELVHIGREDAWSKFFLAFCTAMCWFNPLMWLATNKSSQDLELSCDEIVVSSLDEGERRRYADLILRTAGDGRGFTTCLSASACALRYRLKGIVQPVKKRTGAVLVGVAAGLLILLSNQVGLAYEAGTGESAIYHGDTQQVILEQVRQKTGDLPQTILFCRDEEALTDYLASLSLSELADWYPVYDQEEQMVLLYRAPKDTLTVVLFDDYIKVIPFWEDGLPEHYYYVSGGLDWGKLDQLLGEPV